MRTDIREAGTSALLVAASLLLLFGMAAIAVDVGAGMNERRQDQTAADVAAMGAALDVFEEDAVSEMRDTALSIARQNLPTTYTEQDWQLMWESCSDPERLALNGGDFDFIPLEAPSSWAFVAPGTTLDCLSWDPQGYLRIRIPDQATETAFGRVMGLEELQTSADAIARISTRSGGGGILPFGIVGGATGGDYVCLRDNSGQPPEPCDGTDLGNFPPAPKCPPPETCDETDSGNFGTIDIPIFEYTDGNCYEANKNIMRAINLANGVDHLLKPYRNAAAPASYPGDVEDTCANLEAARIPDTVLTLTGIANGFAEGLATGGNPLPAGDTPRLQQTGNSSGTQTVYGHELDSTPLWHYLESSGASVWDEGAGAMVTLAYDDSLAPSVCDPSSFQAGGDTGRDFDGDGNNDPAASWAHMWECLDAYESGGYDVQIFQNEIADNPRFAYVPQFWEDTWGSGTNWRHIQRFRTTWLQGTFWKKGSNNDLNAFHPGEPGTFNGNAQLRMLTGFIIPDFALPVELRGDPPPFGGVNFAEGELFH